MKDQPEFGADATGRSQSSGYRRNRPPQYEHAIAVLIGKPPAQFNLSPSPQVGFQLPVIPVGIPLTLLERRPDIVAN
jgi:outer membrane protein TolC